MNAASTASSSLDTSSSGYLMPLSDQTPKLRWECIHKLSRPSSCLSDKSPVLQQIAVQHSSDKILTLCSSSTNYIFAGCSNADLMVWDVIHYKLICIHREHKRSILSAALTEKEDFLFTSSSDNTIKIWDTQNPPQGVQCIATILNFQGDIFSLCFKSPYLYCGSQDATIKILDTGELIDSRNHSREQRLVSMESLLVTELRGHFGFIYSLVLSQEKFLISGGADGLIMMWDIEKKQLVKTMGCHDGCVYSMACDGSRIYSAGQDGLVKVWDCDTGNLQRSVSGHTDEVVSIAISPYRFVFTGAADGTIRILDREDLACLYHIHQPNSVMMVTASSSVDGVVYCCSDKDIIVYSSPQGKSVLNKSSDIELDVIDQYSLLKLLQKFISLPTVSSNIKHRNDCWRGAKFLKMLFERSGFHSSLVEGAIGRNPLVFARLGHDPNKPTVLIYGHYDVYPVKHPERWITEPFVLSGHNGYLYGRGMTDNKGPLIAIITAIAEMNQEHTLPTNMVFIIEGEEECDSEGCSTAIINNRSWWQDTDLVLLCNSVWLGEDHPCIHYGLRGILETEVSVMGPSVDLHSGVDGGVINEPMTDMINLLSGLVTHSSQNQAVVNIPNFYDKVKAMSGEEEELFESLEFNVESYRKELGVNWPSSHDNAHRLLSSRWCNPTLSIHSISPTLGSVTGNTVIPASVSAKISMRLVPYQSARVVYQSFKNFVENRFKESGSLNRVGIQKIREGEWWLADPKHEFFQAAEKAIEDVWGKKPLRTREGGTISITSFLERTMEAPAIHLPIGQRSDAAHLPNERIRLENLLKGKMVIKHLLHNVAKTDWRRLREKNKNLFKRTSNSIPELPLNFSGDCCGTIPFT